jgi:predicted transposase YdaD
VGEIDQGFKRLFLLRVDALLQWLLGDIQHVQPVLPDLATERQLVPDTLYRALFEGEPCLVNVEIQSEPDPEMPRRLYLYAARATSQYKLPVISIVIYVFNRGTVAPSPYEMRVGRWLSGHWNFHSIELYRLPPKRLLDAGLAGVLPLVPLTHNASLEDAEEAMRRLTQEQPVEEAQSLGALLAIFLAHARSDKPLALDLYRRFFMANLDNFVRDNPVLHDVWVEVAEKGKAEGKAEGKVEGRAEGMRETIRRVLETRFGPLSEEILTALQSADLPRLEHIADNAAIDTLEQVRLRLGLPTS